MHEAIEYRSLAANLRREAEASLLPRVRELKIAAAERWDILAEEMEHFTAPPAAISPANTGWIF